MNLDALVKKDICQVFLLYSPGNIPFGFAVHPWFVINDHGTLERWEVLFHKRCANELQCNWGHLHKNDFKPFEGIWVIPFFRRLLWGATLLYSIEGVEAKQCIDLIRSSPRAYPYCNTYRLVPGPNSNTYIQWVLNHFPQFNVKLPWNAFGKGYTL